MWHLVFYVIYLIVMYTLFILNGRKTCFDLKIKQVPSVHGCGDEQFCGAWNSL